MASRVLVAVLVALLAAPPAYADAEPQKRLVARHRAHHARAIDAEKTDTGWRFYDGTIGRPYQLLGAVTKRAGTATWEVQDHIGRTLGTIEPDGGGWKVYDPDHRPIATATTHEVRCPNGRVAPRHRKKGFPEIAMHAFFGPDAE